MFIRLPQWKRRLRGAILLLPFLAIWTHNAQGQRASLEPQWKLSASVGGVSFYHALADCNGQKTVLLKIRNDNAYGVEAAWNVSFSDGAAKTENPAVRKTSLQAGETLTSACGAATQRGLLVDPKEVDPTHAVDMGRFSLRQVSVNRLSNQ